MKNNLYHEGTERHIEKHLQKMEEARQASSVYREQVASDSKQVLATDDSFRQWMQEQFVVEIQRAQEATARSHEPSDNQRISRVAQNHASIALALATAMSHHREVI